MMRYNPYTPGRASRILLLALFPGLVGLGSARPFAAAALQGSVRAGAGQAEEEVSPEAAPQVQQVKPNQAAPGEEVTVEVEGQNFSGGVYVSFSNPALRVVSTRRVSATHLETKVAIGKKAQPGTVSLYVSNPAGAVAEVPFIIAGGVLPPAPPAGPPAPAVPTTENQPSAIGTPEVSSVDPPRANRGSQVSLKLTGKNFAKGAKVSFSNPGIRVLETNAPSPTELAARIQIAPDAPTGTTSLFVVNPDDREAEVRFEVAESGPAQPAPPTVAATNPESPGSAAQRFEVYNLGEGVSILQNPNKPKGTLILAGGKLKYEEGGKEVFSAAPGDIKEVEANSYFGVNTGTFHIILNSGKTFNFVAASLRLAESQAIVDSVRRAIH